MTSSGLNKYHLVEEAKSSGLLAMAEIPTPAGRHDVLTGIYDTDHKLNISVVFTSIESTLAAASGPIDSSSSAGTSSAAGSR